MGAACSSEDAVKVEETKNTKTETKTVFGTEKKTVELELGKITVIRIVFIVEIFTHLCLDNQSQTASLKTF